jgi:hypothetical protein
MVKMDESKVLYGNGFNDNGFIMGALLANGGLFGNRLNNGYGYDNNHNSVLMDSINRNNTAIGQTKDMLSAGQNAIQNDVCREAGMINQNLSSGFQNIGQCINDGFANTNLNICNGLAGTNQNIYNSTNLLGKCLSDGFQQTLLNTCQNTNNIINNQQASYYNLSKEVCAGVNNLTLQGFQQTQCLEKRIDDLSNQLKDNEIGRLSDEKNRIENELFTCKQNQAMIDSIRECCCPPCPKPCPSNNKNDIDINIVLQQVQGLANGLSSLANEVGNLKNVVSRQNG